MRRADAARSGTRRPRRPARRLRPVLSDHQLPRRIEHEQRAGADRRAGRRRRRRGVVVAASFRQMARRWRIWFDRVGRRAGGMGGALASAAARATASRAVAARRRSPRFGPFMLGLVVLFSAHRAGAARAARVAEVDRQLRHPDPDLCDARLGPEHRRRPRRPARSRLCRLLRGRRLCLCAACRPTYGLSFWICLPLAGIPRGVLGHYPRAFRCCACAAIISPS